MVERWQQQSRQRLALLVLLSLALHLPLLIAFNNPTILPVSDIATSISVKLVSRAEDKKPAPESEPVSSKKLHRQEKTRQASTRKSNAATAPDHRPQRHTEQTARLDRQKQQDKETKIQPNPEDQPQQAVVTKQPAGQPTTNKARVLDRLQKELPNHFYYPRLARRQGYQGTVTLGFELHQRGYIAKVQILKSSGYRILDLAAKDAVSRMAVSWASRLVHEPSVQIELPVQYILTEG